MLAILDEPVRADDEVVLLLLLLELENEALSEVDPSAIMSVLHSPFRLRVLRGALVIAWCTSLLEALFPEPLLHHPSSEKIEANPPRFIPSRIPITIK